MHTESHSAKTILFLCLFLFLLFALYIFSLSGYADRPPKPEIKHGEFPFKLTYEVNGETIIIEDTLVCDFDGYSSNGIGADWHRDWDMTLKSGEKDIVLLDIKQYLNKELEQAYLRFSAGTAEYYMGDNERFSSGAQDFDIILYNEKFLSGARHESYMSSEEAYEKYGIKLISWECAPQIENHFGK